MIPKFCPECKTFVHRKADFLLDEVFVCNHCHIEFKVFTREELDIFKIYPINKLNESIPGPCSYCGGDHWKPDCPEYGQSIQQLTEIQKEERRKQHAIDDYYPERVKENPLANIPDFPGLDKLNIPGVKIIEEVKFDKPQSTDVKCDSCEYEGNISTFKPAMSVYHDIVCPKCGSTNNKHNSEYTESLLSKMREKK